MKRILNIWLMAAVVCGLGLGMSSCNDDKELVKSEEEQEREAEAQAAASDKFWSVVGQLVSPMDYTDDYEGKTFEPTIGTPDASDPLTRIVLTNSMEAAAREFADLINAEEGIDENTTTHPYKDDAVGTLTYTKVTDGTAWAEVAVNIKQLPHLTKIIYRSAQQGDDNATFGGGMAYYRFGDVIYRTITTAAGTAAKEYWVCVRPSFDPEDKGDSHWATVSPLPKDNVWDYKASNGFTYYFPTKLGTNKKQMQNFAEMLFAIFHGQDWSDNIDNNSRDGRKGMPIFTDFDKANKRYHNHRFWQEVMDAWLAKGITSAVLGIPSNALIPELLNSKDGVRFLYSGYSWHTSFSNTAKLYEAHFTNGQGEKSNMHNVNYYEYECLMIDKKNHENDVFFDITELMTENSPRIVNKKFFEDEHSRWVVRFATGKELGGGHYDPQQAIPGFTELYRYNTVYGVEDLFKEPFISGSDGVVEDDVTKQKRDVEYVGMPYYRLGDVYQDEDGGKWLCVWSAGLEKIDKSPFSYFISFDNIKSDGSRFTNLGNLDATIRGAYMAAFLCHQHYLSRSSVWSIAAKGSGDAMNIGWRGLFPMWWDGKDPTNTRYNVLTLCAPYDSDNNDGQPLLRLQINALDFQENNNWTSVWTNYPSDVYPDKQPTSFTDQPILIKDIASAVMVNKYANERVANLPILYPADKKSTDARAIRTAPDERANEISNYLINISGYNYYASPQPPLSIWNDPIITFRATKIYDRGILNHATKAENGVTLMLLKKNDYWDDYEEYDGYYDFSIRLFDIGMGDLMRYSLLNGKTYNIDWRK